ncbi:response regulator [Undibacterium sp. LX40W]|uniref:Response regulator n=1 Tax=Undibacterium nitidum TaxID=2762298 RepID=A0A923HKR8_9BURK|nr:MULTISPECIES: response regulator [Undibacterium]MBC3881455.1 response regulator [Undibacterium nitidum]MBC3891762.1 response regulator [Undibacterium sp. LX40W]
MSTANTKYQELSVLIVDDDEFQVDFVSDLLNDLGISRVTTANGGQAGLKAFDNANPKPDLLLCDIQMPDIDGFEFMKAMGERKFFGGVILMSGQGSRVLYSASLVAQLSRQNFLGNIEKPVNKKDIAEKIDQMLQNQ